VIAELPYEPYELAAEAGVMYLFDGRVLAECLVASEAFLHPITRAPLDRAECVRLDGYLARHGLVGTASSSTGGGDAKSAEATAAGSDALPKVQVAKAFDDAARKLAAAREPGPSRAEEASSIMSSIFNVYRGGGSASDPAVEEAFSRGRRGRAQASTLSAAMAAALERANLPPAPRPQTTRTDGNFTFVDDDAGMVLGSAAQERIRQRRQVPIEMDFPALPGGAPAWAAAPQHSQPQRPREAFPSLGAAPPAASAENEEEERRSGVATLWGTVAPPPPVTPPAIPPSLPKRPADPAADERAREEEGEEEEAEEKTKEVSEQEQRRRQLAEAFGVRNPEARPSSFAAQDASAFPAEVLATARRNPVLVRSLETKFEKAIAKSTKRLSLDPMSKPLRHLAHELGEKYGATTCSFGSEPNRRVDLFFTPASGLPSLRLSDILKLSDKALADATAAPAAVRHELRLSHVEEYADLRRIFWRNPCVIEQDRALASATVVFETEAALVEALQSLGGGLRGPKGLLFRVETSDGNAVSARQQREESARAREEARRREEALTAAWEGAAASEGAPSAAPAPAQTIVLESWEEEGTTSAVSGVVAPSALPQVAFAKNPWEALAVEGEESD